MKKKGIFWGIVMICTAIIIIIESIGSGLGFFNSIPIIKIILGVICTAWVLTEIVKLKIPHIFFPLAFIFLLFEGEIAGLCGLPDKNLISNWTVLIAALLLTIGTAIIFSKTKFVEKWDFKTPDGFHKITGKNTKYIDSAELDYQQIENHMGSTEIFFENIDSYHGGGTLFIENHMGNCVVHVPYQWKITENIENHMGSVKTSPSNIESELNINITGENHMGSIVIDHI